MKRIRPDFYNEFHCIADSCTITCCQEWKISVDPDTNRKWKKVSAPADVPEQKKNLSAYTEKKDGLRVIQLDSDHHCPFLSENRLCRLVTAYGDKILSETCTTFPREIHRFACHIEETLMPCCPAVIDLLEQADTPQFPDVPTECDTPLFQIRRNILRLLLPASSPVCSAEDYSIEDHSVQDYSIKHCSTEICSAEVCSTEDLLLKINYILQELYRNNSLDETLIRDYFSADTLSQLSDAIQSIHLPAEDTFFECNELLQDLAVNYQSENLYCDFLNPIISLSEYLSESATDFMHPVSFSSLDTGISLSELWSDFQIRFSEVQPLMLKFLANEIFSDLVTPDSHLEDLLIRIQWIALEYSAIRQSLFLQWLQNNRSTLTYEMVRRTLVIITRMTGYEEEDIREYLTNSFEALIWDWGYFALILGH